MHQREFDSPHARQIERHNKMAELYRRILRWLHWLGADDRNHCTCDHFLYQHNGPNIGRACDECECMYFEAWDKNT